MWGSSGQAGHRKCSCSASGQRETTLRLYCRGCMRVLQDRRCAAVAECTEIEAPPRRRFCAEVAEVCDLDFTCLAPQPRCWEKKRLYKDGRTNALFPSKLVAPWEYRRSLELPRPRPRLQAMG